MKPPLVWRLINYLRRTVEDHQAGEVLLVEQMKQQYGQKKVSRVVSFPVRRTWGSTASTRRGERGLVQARGRR